MLCDVCRIREPEGSFDSRSPRRVSKRIVRDAAWMKIHPDRKIRIEGQCDERGSQAYNQVLGEKQAKVVQRYLKDLGVANELTVISFGEDCPWCADHTAACYQQNRRGHVMVRIDQLVFGNLTCNVYCCE